MKAYKKNWEYLSDELMRLNLLIRRNLFKLGKPHQPRNYDEFMGLFFSDEEIDEMLDNRSQSSFTIDASEATEGGAVSMDALYAARPEDAVA